MHQKITQPSPRSQKAPNAHGAAIVTQNGTRVELTPREFDLLLALVRARGQLLYREALYERVWGLDSNAGPRTVDIHIHRLRKKLHWDHKIVTVPKVGYKLLP